MNDNQLFAAIIPIIAAGLTACGLSGIAIKQAFQPTQQGANTVPTCYLQKLPDRRYGSPQRRDTFDPLEQEFAHTETQFYETTFQVNALATQNPSNLASVTPTDILRAASYALQCDAGILALKQAGLGVLRITDIRNLQINDDRDRFESSPSFDFTLTHQQVIVSTVPLVVSSELNVKRV